MKPKVSQTDEDRVAVTETASRRKFIGVLGGVAAALTTGTAATPLLAADNDTLPLATTTGKQRAQDSFRLRKNVARAEFEMPVLPHPNNGDETTFPNKIGNFSKGLQHDAAGLVNKTSYDSLLTAVHSGLPSDFENIVLGGGSKLIDPQAGLAFDLEGTDAGNYEVAAPPSVDSQPRADEAVENYWMALCRDVNFTDYAANPVAQAAGAELSTLPDFTGPKINGQVTAQALYRSGLPGDLIGPHVSQFLLQPVFQGALALQQQYITYLPGIDYLTDLLSWMNAQNGSISTSVVQFDPQPRYLRNARDLAAYQRAADVVQPYNTALLWLTGNRIALNAGNPYNSSKTQVGFGTFGVPHISSLHAEVCTRALKAAWFQKWFVHRTLRPEAYGGLVHLTKTGINQFLTSPDILNSQAVATVFNTYGTYFLPVPYPDGSPLAPSYAGGQATVAGASVTMLKAFFQTDGVIVANPVVPTSDGLALVPYTGGDAGQITVTGELNKLASNMAFGRNLAGLNWRSDAMAGLLLGEQVAISILRDQKPTYNEAFGGFTFTKFDGSVITV